MNLKLSVAGLCALAVSGVTALAETSQYADEIDITKAVEEAGVAKKPVLASGTIAGNTIDNAFGHGMEKDDRILLKEVSNVISYEIAPEYQPAQTIVVTRYAIRRAITVDGWEDLAKSRAPTAFRLEGSSDGIYWVTLDARSDVDWRGSGEDVKSFDIDPLNFGSYRHYRFVTLASASSDGGSKCSFQFVNLFGIVGSRTPLVQSSVGVDHLLTRGVAASTLEDYTPTLDSKLEFDVAFAELSGSVCLFSANRYNETPHFRLFCSSEGRWTYYYGEQSYESTHKVYAGVRYKIVVDGPVVTVNGVKVIDAGESLAASARRPLVLFASQDGDGALWSTPSLSVWSVKASNAAGVPVRELHPILSSDGTGCLFDKIGERVYEGCRIENRLAADYRISKDEVEVTAVVRDAGVDLKEVVTLKEGRIASDSYPYTNIFTPGTTTADRWLMKTVRNVVQYDIPDSFRPGEPIVLTRYAILPCVGGKDDEMLGADRAPTVVELQASKDGNEPWVTLCRRGSGLGTGSYHRGDYKANGYGYNGVNLNIPEINRGDYRHYRFITEDSSYSTDTTCPLGIQELRFFGFIGGGAVGYEPVEYVQNANEDPSYKSTYFRTGVTPRKADLTVELTGEFTQTSATMGLICCRGANSANPWVLFLNGGKLYLIYGSVSRTYNEFPIEANKLYSIAVVGDEVFVNGNSIGAVPGSTDFTPGSEMVLMASHNALGNINNQARFKLHSCKVTDPLKGVIRDYIPVKRTSDGVAGLFDRVNSKFVPSSNEPPKAGAVVDVNIRQGGRSLALENEPAETKQLPDSLEFAFGENQILPEGLYAAFDNERHTGTSSSDWAKVVKLTDVTSGVDSFSVKKLQNEEQYKYVKFFLCDDLGYGQACTKTFKACNKGLFIVIK